MALRKIEHLYAGHCHCGAHASRHRWRMIGAVGIIGVFAMAALGHDGGSQAASSGSASDNAAGISVSAPAATTPPASTSQPVGRDAYPISGRNYIAPDAAIVPAASVPIASDLSCNAARIAGTADPCSVR